MVVRQQMVNKRRCGHPGTSIVEVLVAMVVLVIGIFGIIRVFPTGFSVIQYGEHVSAASKLLNAALEQARSNSQNLPDAMVPIVYDPKTGIGTPDINFTPAAEAHDLNLPVTALAADPNLARFTGFNRTRRVIGETTKIPAPSTDVPYMPIDPEAPQGSSR